jgi:hypothetical protein
MGNVYSTRLLSWAGTETPPAYVCPAGFVTVVRDADVTSSGGEIINFQLSVNDVALFWRGQFTIEALGQNAQWRGRQIMLPGELLVYAADGATDGLVSGYQLGLP